jgi:hypothetical protein
VALADQAPPRARRLETRAGLRLIRQWVSLPLPKATRGEDEMAKAEASVEELVSMIERGELRLPEMQRRYVWRAPRVRDLLDSLYRGYPSGAILLWDTDDDVPLQDFAIQQSANPYKRTRLLLDGQQRLTSLAAVIRGKPLKVRGRKKPIDLLFNLEHPDDLEVVTEVNEDGVEGDELVDDTTDSSEDELQRRFDGMTFVVATKRLARLPHWVSVTDVFKSDDIGPFLEQAGVEGFKDSRYKKYSDRLTRLRNISKYVYRMDVLERTLSYEEVTEIFVRINSLGAKLRSSDLALAQITAKWPGSLRCFTSSRRRARRTASTSSWRYTSRRSWPSRRINLGSSPWAGFPSRC